MLTSHEYGLRSACMRSCTSRAPLKRKQMLELHSTNCSQWLFSTAGLGFRFGLRLRLQTIWLHSIMQNMFSLTQIQILIPFPNGCCTHFKDGSLSQGQISVPITYISIRGSKSESEPMEKSCIVQESVSESKSESGNGNKP